MNLNFSKNQESAQNYFKFIHIYKRGKASHLKNTLLKELTNETYDFTQIHISQYIPIDIVIACHVVGLCAITTNF